MSENVSKTPRKINPALLARFNQSASPSQTLSPIQLPRSLNNRKSNEGIATKEPEQQAQDLGASVKVLHSSLTHTSPSNTSPSQKSVYTNISKIGNSNPVPSDNDNNNNNNNALSALTPTEIDNQASVDIVTSVLKASEHPSEQNPSETPQSTSTPIPEAPRVISKMNTKLLEKFNQLDSAKIVIQKPGQLPTQQLLSKPKPESEQQPTSQERHVRSKSIIQNHTLLTEKLKHCSDEFTSQSTMKFPSMQRVSISADVRRRPSSRRFISESSAVVIPTTTATASEARLSDQFSFIPQVIEEERKEALADRGLDKHCTEKNVALLPLSNTTASPVETRLNGLKASTADINDRAILAPQFSKDWSKSEGKDDAPLTTRTDAYSDGPPDSARSLSCHDDDSHIPAGHKARPFSVKLRKRKGFLSPWYSVCKVTYSVVHYSVRCLAYPFVACYRSLYCCSTTDSQHNRLDAVRDSSSQKSTKSVLHPLTPASREGSVDSTGLRKGYALSLAPSTGTEAGSVYNTPRRPVEAMGRISLVEECI